MLQKRILQIFSGLIVGAFLALAACSKTDFDKLELEDHSSEFAFPLFSTTLRLDDLMFRILNDTLSGDTIFVNPDNTMTLFYTGNVAEKPASDIFNFLKEGIVPLNDTTFTFPFDSPDSVSIKRANIKKGTIGLVVFNSTGETLTINFVIPQMTKNGVGFRETFIVPSHPTDAYTTPRIDLTGYLLQSETNELTFKYEAYRPNGDRIKLPPTAFGLPGVVAGFQELEFSYLQGYWGYSTYELTRDVIEIDINQTQLDGNVKVKNPRVTMRIANSWGFPTRGVIRYLSFIGQNGEELELKSTAFQTDSFDYVDFDYPKFGLGEIGQTKFTDITLNETNSNIAEIFNLQPVKLVYEVDGIANAQKDPSIVGFLTDSSTISLSMRVELLLEGSAQNFGAEQTLDLDFGEYSSLDTSKIESVEFKLVAENSTPISTALQLYFRDENGNNIDSLFTGEARLIMEAAAVNSEGVSIETKRTENFINMDAARFERIRQAKTAFLKTAFTTTQNGEIPVKLLATNQTTVKMGIKVKTRF